MQTTRTVEFVLHAQQRFGAAVPPPVGYQLHQLFHPKQTRHSEGFDGLPVRKVYAPPYAGIPYVTDCVVAELEKFGVKYRIALKITKDPRFEKLKCEHRGTYADDCIVDRVRQHRIYIVATCDKDLKRRVRKVPGVPIMYISNHKYTIERMAEAYGAPR